MKKVHIGKSGTDVYKACKIAGLSFRFQLTKNPSYTGSAGNPFGVMRNGVPRVNLQRARVKITRIKNGVPYVLYNDRLHDISMSTTVGTTAYEYARFADTFQILDSDTALLPIRINFPSPIVLDGNDELQVHLSIDESFLLGSAVSYNTLSTPIGALDVISSQGGTTFFQKVDTTFCEIDTIQAHPDAVESATWYIKTYRPDNNQSSLSVSLGDNVTNVQIINTKYSRLGEQIDYLNSIRTIESLTLSGEGFSDTADYIELCINKLNQHENGFDLAQYRNHEVLYNDIARDLDRAKIEGTFISDHITADNTCLIWTSFYSDLRMQQEAQARTEFAWERKIKRLGDANPKYSKLYKK